MGSKALEYNYLMQSIPFNAQKWDLNAKEDARISRSLTLKAKIALAVAIILAILIITVIVICFALPSSTQNVVARRKIYMYNMPDYNSNSRLGKFASAAISTDAAPCAVIGRDILAKNGSAVDAAIAVLLCMGVVNPQSMGLGGGFLMLFYNKSERKAYYLDARETAPESATRDMFEGNATLAKMGGLSIAIPGELAGYYVAHEKFGNLPWEDLFPPTIRLCKEGIAVNKHLAKALKKYEKNIQSFEAIRNVFVNNKTGKVFEEHDIMKRPDLAKTLETIANESMSALYGPRTKLSKEFLADLKAAGSIITERDMLKYSPKWRTPIEAQLRDNMTLYAPSPPGSGALLTFMLRVLSGYSDINANVTRYRDSTLLTLHRVVETFKFAYARRMEMEDDDSKEMEELMKNLTSHEYADYIRSLIDDTKTYNNVDHYGINVTVQEDHGTAHVSIVAPNGDAVSVTSTINLYFGSMVMSQSTGIILNDEMDDFVSPNITNYFGVPPGNKNFIRPGKRPMSSMTPTIIVDPNGDVRLTLGANGGTQITTSIAQVILRNLWLGDNVKRSIDGPRLHHQLLPNYIEHENLFPEDLLEDLRKMGHKTHHLGAGMIGIVMGITRDKDGYLYANSDYRKGGEVDGY
ncbi:scoloptoxin SSD14-like isoform X2 [Stegodyphus dumicola]|uniref:scoloptoxin SSD14-like isoform X2 n=1 Tax=Stegodyphus dumicola TaxID=202533 RepID=UPI0015B28FE8|nr:scoloptoxin SSD14-like isoform X2 [Stegodyphus dumicola]